MKNVLTYLGVLITLSCMAQHQGDYIQYMFNGVLINPAYAGSQDALNLTALYRNQWLGIEGAPVSKSFSAHTPLKNKKLNLGFVVENEKYGLYDRTALDVLYAYRFNFLKGTLALGISGGLDVASTNWSRVITTDSDDPNFTGDGMRKTSLAAGSGIHYTSKIFYAGFSCPQLLDNNSYNKSATLIFNSGFLSDISTNIKVKPAVLIKYIPGSPVAANVSATFYYKEFIGIGLGYTHNSSAMCIIDARINDQLRFGYGYDFSFTKLRNYTSGSHEVMLRYLFSYKVKAVSARYF